MRPPKEPGRCGCATDAGDDAGGGVTREGLDGDEDGEDGVE
jgi:hypothetical protein